MKKAISFLFCLLAFLLCGAPAFALAAPALDAVPPVDDIALFGSLALAVLEVVLRLKPTNKDYSLVTKLVKVLNLILPANRAKTPAGTGIFQLINFKKASK